LVVEVAVDGRAQWLIWICRVKYGAAWVIVGVARMPSGRERNALGGRWANAGCSKVDVIGVLTRPWGPGESMPVEPSVKMPPALMLADLVEVDLLGITRGVNALHASSAFCRAIRSFLRRGGGGDGRAKAATQRENADCS